MRNLSVKLLLNSLIVFTSTVPLIAAETVTAYRNGEELFVKSEYSPKEDIIIRIFRKANEAAYLVPKNTPITDYAKGTILHFNGDEYPATSFTGYGFLSGNHGSAYARKLTIPNHGLTDKDLGAKVTDGKNNIWRIMQILSPKEIMIHPESTGPVGTPKWTGLNNGTPIFRDGKEFPYQDAAMVQMGPLNRITKAEFLVDGTTPLPDRTEVKCAFVDQILHHDVIAPESMVEWNKNNPGKRLFPEIHANGAWGNSVFNTPEIAAKYPEYMKLPALITVENKFRFLPHGCVVSYRTNRIHTKLGINSLELMFGWNGAIAAQQKEEFYIPKLKPLQGKNAIPGQKPYALDFTAIQPWSGAKDINYNLNPSDCIDPTDPADRFVILTGTESVRKYGIVLGYSLVNGHTAKVKKGKERSFLYHFWKTKKMYPYAFSIQNTEPGREVKVVAYKQYLNPAAEPDATAFHFHKEGDSLLVYLDLHKPLKNKKFQLPKEYTGHKITVVEQTPSVTLYNQDVLSEDGITLDMNGKHGYLVLKLDQ